MNHERGYFFAFAKPEMHLITFFTLSVDITNWKLVEVGGVGLIINYNYRWNNYRRIISALSGVACLLDCTLNRWLMGSKHFESFILLDVVCILWEHLNIWMDFNTIQNSFNLFICKHLAFSMHFIIKLLWKPMGIVVKLQKLFGKNTTWFDMSGDQP